MDLSEYEKVKLFILESESEEDYKFYLQVGSKSYILKLEYYS